jgi:hypothetical protein
MLVIFTPESPELGTTHQSPLAKLPQVWGESNVNVIPYWLTWLHEVVAAELLIMT